MDPRSADTENRFGLFFPFLANRKKFFLPRVCVCHCILECRPQSVSVDRNVFLLMREVFSITAQRRSGNRWSQMTGDKVALSQRSPSRWAAASLTLSRAHAPASKELIHVCAVGRKTRAHGAAQRKCWPLAALVQFVSGSAFARKPQLVEIKPSLTKKPAWDTKVAFV